MTGHVRPESPVTMLRNARSRWSEIRIYDTHVKGLGKDTASYATCDALQYLGTAWGNKLAQGAAPAGFLDVSGLTPAHA
jgi:hypothetical protein